MRRDIQTIMLNKHNERDQAIVAATMVMAARNRVSLGEMAGRLACEALEHVAVSHGVALDGLSAVVEARPRKATKWGIIFDRRRPADRRVVELCERLMPVLAMTATGVLRFALGGRLNELVKTGPEMQGPIATAV